MAYNVKIDPWSILKWVIILGVGVGVFFVGKWYGVTKTVLDPSEYTRTIDSLRLKNDSLIYTIKSIPLPNPKEVEIKVKYIDKMKPIYDPDSLLESLNRLSVPEN